ncbi:AAA family ATPase [Rhodovastum sp. RN2-1]|uniref:AAA family ATPase n=1 Tax=Limobrevibacterium gyesilva TaxID=2991712 RepID=A0AA42CG07_9PROT|nr:AAA family ATPase [Limobrevibacterium gyesilva]
MHESKGALIVFGGLPGTGKTTLARAVAETHSATYLRIDTIEQTLRCSGTLAGDVGPAGYLIAYALAESNLLLGRTVIADSVNPLAVTREAWRRVAARTSSAIVEIEIICSDAAEHRRRVETRSVDVAGLDLPSWEDVIKRDYEPWDCPRIVLDTAGCTIPGALEELQKRMNGSGLVPRGSRSMPEAAGSASTRRGGRPRRRSRTG